MAEERDARLILQAEDRASRTFAQVAKSIKEVRAELELQVAAAAKGEGDVNKLTGALTKLKDLGQDLVRGQSLLKSFEGITERVTKAEDRLTKARAALAAYQDQLGKGGPATDAQTTKLERLETAVTKAQGGYDKASKAFTLVSERMERAGLVAGKFDQQTDAIAASAREAAQGMAIASQAVDGYAGHLARAEAEQRKLSEAQALKTAVAQSPLSSADIAYVLSFDNAMQKLRETEALYAREQRASVASAEQVRAQRRAAVTEALEGNQELISQFDKLERESHQQASVAAFRQIGTDAAAAALDLNRFGGATETAGVSVERLANRVRAIVQPIRTAAATIEGATTLIGEAEAVAFRKGGGDINAYSQAIGKLAEAERGLIQQAGLVDSFKQQETAVAALEAQLKSAQTEVISIGQKISQADEPVDEWAQDLKKAQANMESLGGSLTAEKQKLASMSASLRQAGIDSNELAAAEEHLIATTRRLGLAQTQLRGKQTGKGGFLGLNPYELQNLGYQINDVFTQLASGTSLTQTLGQQGGQILQLFRGAIPMILRFLPLIGAVVVVLGTLGAAAKRANEEVQSMREWKAVFASMGEGADYSAKSFVDAQRKLEDLGHKAEEAKEVLKKFIKEGLNPDDLAGFITTANDLAEITGKKVPDAANLMAEAFSGGMDKVVALNDATNQFTDDQLDEIQGLFNAGKADEARAEAMRITQEQTQKGIAQMEGPLAAAHRGAKQGWDNLLDAFSRIGRTMKDSVEPWLNWLKDKINNTAIGWVYLTALMKGATAEAAKAQALGILVPGSTGGAKQGGNLPADPNRRTDGGQEYLRQQQTQLRAAKAITQEQRIQVAMEQARNEAAKAGASDREVALAAENARNIEQTRVDKENAAAARSAASRARAAENRRKAEERRAEAFARKVRDLQQGVDNQIAAMDAKIDKAQGRTLEQRLKSVDDEYAKVFAAIDKAQADGVSPKITAEQRERVRQNIILIKQLETMKYYEETIKNLVEQRKRGLDAVDEAYARGEITAAEAVKRAREISEKINPAIAEMAEKAITFAEALNSAHPSPVLETFIQNMRSVLAENSGAGAAKALRDFTDRRIADEATRLNNIIDQRNQLVAAETNLVKLGLQTKKGAQTEIEAGYARTQPLLDQQLASFQALLATLDLTNPAIKLLYDTWQAKLQTIKKEGTYVSATFTELKQGIDSAITQNAMEGFDTIAKALGALVTGGNNVINTFGAIGMAALNFVGQTIGAIGRLILQMLILDAIQKITGIPVAALAGAMNGSGSMSGGSMFGFLKGIFGKIFHGGGIAGTDKYGRTLPAIAWAGAPRYHGGGIAGFAPDEVPAVLKKHEEVLTEDDPRHRNNFRGGAAAPPRIRQVLVMDKRELAAAMASAEGEEVVMTHIRRNRSTLRQVLGAN